MELPNIFPDLLVPVSVIVAPSTFSANHPSVTAAAKLPKYNLKNFYRKWCPPTSELNMNVSVSEVEESDELNKTAFSTTSQQHNRVIACLPSKLDRSNFIK